MIELCVPYSYHSCFLSQESCFLFSLSLCLCQGYPQALLPLTVAGIPSIHICLDFIPELLAQPQLEKQVKPPNLPLLSSLFPGSNSWTCHGLVPEPLLHCHVFLKALVNICVHTDLCNPVAVVLVYPVRPTQVPQCGQVGH